MKERLLSFNYMLLSLGTVSLAYDSDGLRFYIGCLLSVTMGYMLKMGMLYKANELTWKTAIVQAIITVPVCYFSLQLWIYYEWTLKIQVYLFIISLFCIYIADMLDKWGKIGIRAYLRTTVRRFMAETKEDDQ